MERPALTVEIRTETKKGGARKLRAKGQIPAIFYGPRSKAVPLRLSPKDLTKTLQTEAGKNVLIDLDIQGAGSSDRKVVMVKDLQIDPLRRNIIHVDFYEVAMDVMVTVDVPIHLIGISEGVKLGGILEQVRRTIQIQCLPGEILKFVEVDVTPLMIGDSIHVRDIQLEKVKILSDLGMTVVTVVPPAAEETKVTEEEVAEVAETAEGEVKEEKKEEKKEKGKEGEVK